MNSQAKELNDAILANNPGVFEMLSTRGQEIYFPKKGILGQSAEAASAKINATIGTAVDDDGTPMRLKSIASKVNLDAGKVFPYAPSFGRPDIRKRWKEMIYEKNPSLANKEISLPVVTNALTHGISMVGFMFVNDGDEVIIPSFYWDNYDLVLGNGYGANLKQYNLFKNGKHDTRALRETLLEGPIGKKIVVLNFPNNPSGYTPTVSEMQDIVEAIKASADKGNKVIAVLDDAYFGLVYEHGVELESALSYMAELSENVLVVKCDGPTKEDYVWGFRVGFMTYAIKGGNAALYGALESKTAGAVRGNISNASNLSQSLLMEAFTSTEYAGEKKEKFEIMQSRYNEVKAVLENESYKQYFNALPYNSGYFMCIELANGLDGEETRQLLIKKYGIGVICFGNLLRIAYSSVSVKNIKPLFDGILEACKELSKN